MTPLTAGATADLPVFDVLGRSNARRERELALADGLDRKSTRLNSSHLKLSRMPSSA